MLTFTVEPRKVWVPHRGKNVLTHPIRSLPHSILVAQGTGDFYLQYWEEGEKRGDEKIRRWRRYGDVWSLYRGLKLARHGTLLKRLPTLEELRGLCADANITLAHGAITAGQLAEIKANLLTVLATLRHPRTHALKEVVVQVEFVVPLRDSKGRLNTGALAARLVPVKNRLFVERVTDIAEWLGYYAHWEQDVQLLLQLAGGFLPAFDRLVAVWVGKLADITVSPQAMLAIAREIKPHADAVVRLEPFGGWSNWARNCSRDFREATAALTGEDREAALAALRRILQSVKTKRLQADVSNLLLDIQLDATAAPLQPERYVGRLEAMLEHLADLDDGQLRTPVVATLSAQFRATMDALRSAQPDRTRVKVSREHLRAACAAL